MTDSPIIAYLDQQRQKRCDLHGRPWPWNHLADRADLGRQTLFQLRTGRIEFNFRHWLCLANNAHIAVPMLLLSSELRQEVVQHLHRTHPRSPQLAAVPCGAHLDWSPEIRCAHWRGNNASKGSGCYHENCPRRPHNQETELESHHE